LRFQILSFQIPALREIRACRAEASAQPAAPSPFEISNPQISNPAAHRPVVPFQLSHFHISLPGNPWTKTVHAQK